MTELTNIPRELPPGYYFCPEFAGGDKFYTWSYRDENKHWLSPADESRLYYDDEADECRKDIWRHYSARVLSWLVWGMS